MKYYFNNIIKGYSAMISSHGYFKIEKDNKIICEEDVKKLNIKYSYTIDDINIQDCNKLKERLIKFIKDNYENNKV